LSFFTFCVKFSSADSSTIFVFLLFLTDFSTSTTGTTTSLVFLLFLLLLLSTNDDKEEEEEEEARGEEEEEEEESFLDFFDLVAGCCSIISFAGEDSLFFLLFLGFSSATATSDFFSFVFCLQKKQLEEKKK